MIEQSISAHDLMIARDEAARLGALRHSITEGTGNVAGTLGELATARLLTAARSNTYNHDLVLLNTKTADVKTKICTSKPQMNYECSIAAYNIKQRTDYYIFCRVLKDYSKIWILGYMPKEEYFDRARYCEKGTIDEKSHLRWRFKESCYNLEIGQLYKMEQLMAV